jgi:hypothetical protein
MRFGVNYTPSTGWFHSWLDFNPADVRRDLSAVAGLGVDHIRLMPLWPLIQPNRGMIRKAALDDVVTVINIAGDLGLDVNVDALQGHLSSFDFVPSWLETWHRRNMFTDPDVVGSLEAYVKTLAAAVADRPNLLGITLGNEVNQFAAAPHPAPHPVTPAGAGEWLRRLTAAARAEVPSNVLVTHAMYDAAWYDDTQPFEPGHAVDHGDATITHSWVFNGAAQAYGGLGSGSVRHAEYLCRLAAAWHTAPRPVWLQEVGAPTNVVDVDDTAEFLERTLRHVAAVDGLYGITWWCSHDVGRELLDFPELEYDLGLITSDGHIKATGARFAEMITRLRAGEVPVADVRDQIVLDDTVYGHRAASAPRGDFYRAWLDAAGDGPGPRIVLASRGF